MTLKRMTQTLIVALLVAGPAGAEESDYLVEAWKRNGYWRVQGGWSYPDDSDLSDSVFGNSSLSDTGAVGVAIGVHLIPNVRIDLLEFSWRRYDIDIGPFDGDVDAYTLLTNVYYIPFPDWRFSPFAGLGIGFMHASADVSSASESNTDFAWNVRTGVEYRLIERATTGCCGVSLQSEYRFLMDHGAIDDELPVHEVLFGVALKFY